MKRRFPPGVTVDELRQYRKKRPPHLNRPHDNLHVEEGSLKSLKTEYVRRFHAHSMAEVLTSRSERKDRNETRIQLAADIKQTAMDEYRESFINFPRARPKIHRPHQNLESLPNAPMEFITEKTEKYVPFRDVERAKSLRRTTALKPEGEMMTETESQRQFHIHDKVERVRPIKRGNYFKIEGLFENLTSEQKEKYIAYLMNQRPALRKRQTQLKLEGEMEMSTECSLQYIPPSQQQRPLLRKRSTSLKLDGEVEFWPEYRRSFVEFPRSRPIVTRPHSQLKPEGDLSLATEQRSQFINFPKKDISMSEKNGNNKYFEGSVTPEYREQFIKYGRSKSDLIRRTDNLTLEGNFCFETEKDKYRKSAVYGEENGNFGKEVLAAGLPTKRSQSCNRAKTPQSVSPKMSSDLTAEYRSQFVDFPRKRPTITKPYGNLTASTEEFKNISEKQFQYHSYGNLSKTQHKKRPASNLTLEGDLEGSAEYTRSFVEHPLSVQRRPKPSDSFSKEYPSFQVLEVSQGEIRNGRKARYAPEMKQSNYFSVPSESNQFLAESGSPIDRPTYRLEVHNADGEPKGFHRGPERVFPREAVVSRPFPSSEKHQEALQAALKRKESYERIGTPTNGGGNISRMPSRPQSGKSMVDENGNDKSFVVIDNVTRNTTVPLKEGVQPPETDALWESPAWMESVVSQTLAGQ